MQGGIAVADIYQGMRDISQGSGHCGLQRMRLVCWREQQPFVRPEPERGAFAILQGPAGLHGNRSAKRLAGQAASSLAATKYELRGRGHGLHMRRRMRAGGQPCGIENSGAGG